MDVSDTRINYNSLIASNSAATSANTELTLQQTILQGKLAEYFSATKTNTKIWKTEKLNIDSHKEPRGSVNALPSNITSFFAENEGNIFVRNLKKLLSEGRAMISHELENYPELPIPTQKGLLALAQHYNQKYGISISPLHLKDLKPFLVGKGAELKNRAVPEYFGLIIHEDDAQTQVGHTIPVLACLMPENKELECFIMDVTGISDPTGPDADKLDNRLRRELAEYGVKKILNSDEFRQADTLSCRTGSLVLLRNALLSLKQQPYTNGLIKNLEPIEAAFFSRIRDGLSEMKIPLQYSSRLVQDVLLTMGINPENLPKAARIPPEWAYFEQIFKSSLKGRVVRDSYSCKQEKKEHTKTIAEFRKKNQEVCTFVARLNIEVGKDLFERFKRLVERGNIPPANSSYELIVEEDKRFVKISIKVTKSVNTYLQKKAFRNVELLQRLHT